MNKIIIGFSEAKSKYAILAKLIMLAEKTNFSHTYIKVYSEEFDRELIYQANGSGVYFVTEFDFLKHSWPVAEYDFDISVETKKSLLGWAWDTVGKPYGKLSLIGLGIKRLLALVGIKTNNPFSDGNKSYVCAELVAEATKKLGKSIKEAMDDVDLVDIKRYVEELYKLQKETNIVL